MTDIAVVGSANLDVVVPVDRHPGVGETVLGGDHVLVPGGKGANQAVAAARLGAAVALVGRTGDDDAGETLRRSIEGAGVETTHLRRDAVAPSGLALITVGPDGDNAIVVSPGANGRVSPADVAEAAALIGAVPVLLMQLEIPYDAVAAAASRASGTVVLDPAPAPDPGTQIPLTGVDIIVPNETELARISEGLDAPTPDPDSLDELIHAARRIPVETVVVTLGARGALVVDRSTATHVPAPTITPVDTTGAGDAFRAALAVGLLHGADLGAVVAEAVRVGAAAAMRPGAQPAMPTPAEVDELLATS